MLYISRYVDFQKYGVVDTDDGVEQVAVRSDIINYIRAGVQIRGVTLGKRCKFVPYQPTGTFSAYQSKLLAVAGVDTTVYDGIISRITWDKCVAKSPVDIMLSKLGSALGPFALGYNEYIGPTKVILVFDDSIDVLSHSVVPHSLSMENGVRYDLRKVTRDDIRNAVYLALYQFLDYEELAEMVIDLSSYREKIRGKLVRSAAEW